MKEYIVAVEDDVIAYEEYSVGYIRRQKKLIRCEECTSCIEQKLTDGQRWSYCGILRRVTEDDGFCAWAEPKETE